MICSFFLLQNEAIFLYFLQKKIARLILMSSFHPTPKKWVPIIPNQNQKKLHVEEGRNMKETGKDIQIY
jgi:hypothetical protein